MNFIGATKYEKGLNHPCSVKLPSKGKNTLQGLKHPIRQG